MKLQARILLPIIVFFILLMGVSSFLSYKEASQSLRDSLLENMHGQSEAAMRATAELIRSSSANIQRTAEREEVLSFFKGDPADVAGRKHLSAALDMVNRSYPDFSVMSAIDSNGMIVASSDTSLVGKVNLSKRAYFQKALRGEFSLSEPFFSEFSKTVMIVAATPVHVDGAIVGVLYGAISLDNYYANSIAPIVIGSKGFAYVIDANGHVVAAQNKSWIFNEKLPAVPLYRELAAEKTAGWREVVGNDGKPVVVYYTKEPTSGLTLIVRAEVEDVFSALDDMLRNSVLISAISVLLCSLMVFFIVRPVVGALNKSMHFAQQVAAGNLSGQLDVNRSDEIGALAQALRTIPDVLQRVTVEYADLELRVSHGQLDAHGDASKFSGEFATLVGGTNALLDRFRGIIDAIPSPIAVFDEHQKAAFLNKAAVTLTGSAYAGKTSGELFGAADFGTASCAVKQAVITMQAATAETHLRVQGQTLDVSYTVTPMKNEQGTLVSLLQLFTDLTAIKNTQRTIVEVANIAHNISDRVAAASEQLSAQIEQTSRGTDVQRSRVTSTATAMEEMNATVLEVARNAAEASSQAENTRGKATQGAHVVNEVIGAIKHMNVASHELEENMKELGEQAEAIGSVMNVISDIADQTNLLALNAAIEAARAGEAGRGFAVVADEVRKLAEKTMQATTEVGSSIKGIQSSTTGNIKRVGEAVSEAVKAAELAGASGTALEEILQLANANSSLIASIATAAEEQSATSEEINMAVEEINNIANDTATGMEQSFIAVRELSDMAQELKSTLDKLK